MNGNKPLLQVLDMSVSFEMYKNGIEQNDIEVISNLSIDIYRGEILGIVGSSGSGKSVLAHGIMGLLPENAIITGDIEYDDEELTFDRLKTLRGRKIALVPQSISYLDPLVKVGRQVQGTSKGKTSQRRQRESFKRYGLSESVEKLYPFQLSGGMARRVMVSTVDQQDVDLIIADEPTPGLDLDVAMRTLKYFREFANKEKSVMLITHDIDLAIHVSDRIAVFYGGTVVEIAPVIDFHVGEEALRHPYTKALFNALPQNGFIPIKGSQPYDKDIPRGCLFKSRCPMGDRECNEKIPMRKLRDGMVRCKYAT